MSQEVRINGLFHLLINGIYWGYNPLILTIDPNFVGHPRRGPFFVLDAAVFYHHAKNTMFKPFELKEVVPLNSVMFTEIY